MMGSLLTWFPLQYLWGSPFALLIFGLQLWMFVDAIRQREWVWALFILFGFGLKRTFPG